MIALLYLLPIACFAFAAYMIGSTDMVKLPIFCFLAGMLSFMLLLVGHHQHTEHDRRSRCFGVGGEFVRVNQSDWSCLSKGSKVISNPRPK